MTRALWAVFCMIPMALPAYSDAILADGAFHEFIGFTVGAPVQACAGLCLPSINPSGILYTVVTPWTYTGSANLLVLDLFLSGDQYEVFDNGISLGQTSTPGSELQCGLPALADIACSISTPNFSRGTYLLGSGSHSITINYVKTTSVAHSGAALQLTATPEPANFVPFGLALLAIRWIARRRDR